MSDSPVKALSASLRDASLYPKDVGRRRVTLEEVHSQKHHMGRSRVGEFLEVRVLHSFVVRKNGFNECNIILADQTDYITAILYCPIGNGYDPPEIYKRLKVNDLFRIHHFQVESQTYSAKVFLLRKQHKRLNLSGCINSIERMPSYEQEISRSFKTHIPFTLTKFSNVDQNLNGEFIDLIAFVQNIDFDMKPGGKYQRILQLSRTLPEQSNSPRKITEKGKYLYLRVYERFVDVFLTKESCYVFSNLKVTYSPLYGLKLLTTVHSIIVEVFLDKRKEKITEDYKDADSIADLYKKGAAIGINSDESQESDDSLWCNLSLLKRSRLDPGDHAELPSFSQTAQATETSSQLKENAIIKLENNSSPAASTNSVESRNSPNKRPNSPEGSTSPSKKLCQTPSQPLTEVVYSNASQEEETQSQMMNTPEEFYDCEHGGWSYEVNVKVAKSFPDIKRDDTYFMRSKIRGVALIINNIFEGDSSLERRGTLEDLKRLRDLLMQLGFNVLVKTDLQSWQIRETIQEVKRYILDTGVNQIDSLFVAVLSHGVMGAVEMTDEINIKLFNDLIHPFDEENFSDFKGKPKIFVVQTCQHHPNSQTVKFTRSILTPPERTKMKNIIVCQGACPGQFSYRNPKLGTYMIYVLVHVMMKHAHHMHFEEIMRKVQAEMGKLKCDLKHELTCCWMPFQFKKMYFNPGLYED